MSCEKIPKKSVRGKSDVRQIKNKILQKMLIPWYNERSQRINLEKKQFNYI